MRYIFAATTQIGYDCLKAAIDYGAEVVGIVTVRADDALHISGLAQFSDIAESNNIPLIEVEDINAPAVVDKIRELKPDYLSVIGWSQMIGKELLEIPVYGCFNIHPSLLPKNRGKATLAWTLIKGLDKSGVTLNYLDEYADSGDIICQKEIIISQDDNASSYYEKVKKASATLLVSMLPNLERGMAPRRQQNHMEASYWPRRAPEDGIIDWRKSASELHNWIRGLSCPFPGAFTYLNRKKIVIWTSMLCEKDYHGKPGEIVDIIGNEVVIKTGDGCLTVENLEMEGIKSFDETVKHLRKGVVLNEDRYGIDAKGVIRREKRSIRSMQSAFEKIIKDGLIKDRLLLTEEYRNACHISVYASMKSEVDTREIIRYALSRGKKISVPSTLDGEPCMRLLDSMDSMDSCAPYHSTGVVVDPSEISLVIVPGIAFDDECRRIGSGSGFYDRFLKKINSVPAIGLAYDFQIVDEIPEEPHDVRVNKVLTEKRLIS